MVIGVGEGRKLSLTRLVVARSFGREHGITRPRMTRESKTAALENAGYLQKLYLQNTVE